MKIYTINREQGRRPAPGRADLQTARQKPDERQLGERELGGRQKFDDREPIERLSARREPADSLPPEKGPMPVGRASSERKHNPGAAALTVMFWLILWQLAAVLVNKPLLLPGPVDTVKTLMALAGTPEFYLNIGWTLFRCIASMALSFVLGALASACAYRISAVRRLLSLPVGFFKAVPVMAIIIYVILIAEADWVAIIVCFLMCFPIVYTNILAGLDSVSPELKEVAYIYRLTGIQQLRYIYAPSVRTQVNSAVRLIAGLSWKAVVAAEVLSIPKYSLGYEMINAKYYLETPTLLAYIVVIVALSIGIERLISLCLSKTESRAYTGSKLLKKNRIAACGAAPANEGADKSDRVPVIELRNINKRYGDKTVLDCVSAVFKRGEVTIVEGPSGTGKTTLARIISGLEAPDSGQVTADTEKTVAYLFQEDRLIPWLNVYDNLAVGILADDGACGFGGGRACAGADARNLSKRILPKDDMIVEMAQALEISDALWKLPSELSGGMKHRVALGRTFLAPANVMILDEPFRGLDESLRRRILDNLWPKATSGKTVIVITHQPGDFK